MDYRNADGTVSRDVRQRHPRVRALPARPAASLELAAGRRRRRSARAAGCATLHAAAPTASRPTSAVWRLAGGEPLVRAQEPARRAARARHRRRQPARRRRPRRRRRARRPRPRLPARARPAARGRRERRVRGARRPARRRRRRAASGCACTSAAGRDPLLRHRRRRGGARDPALGRRRRARTTGASRCRAASLGVRMFAGRRRRARRPVAGRPSSSSTECSAWPERASALRAARSARSSPGQPVERRRAAARGTPCWSPRAATSKSRALGCSQRCSESEPRLLWHDEPGVGAVVEPGQPVLEHGVQFVLADADRRVRPDRREAHVVGNIVGQHGVDIREAESAALRRTRSSARSLTSTAHTVASRDSSARVRAIGPQPQPRSSRLPPGGGAGTFVEQHRVPGRCARG